MAKVCTNSVKSGEHLQALAKYGERIIMLLDPSKVMTFEEYQAIKETNPDELADSYQ